MQMPSQERPQSTTGSTKGASWFKEQKRLVAEAERKADDELDQLMKDLPDFDLLLPRKGKRGGASRAPPNTSR